MGFRSTIGVLGTADWDHPIATNQHFLVEQLSHEADVVYVESLGLRRPRLRKSDLERAFHRLRGRPRDGVSRPRPGGLRVVSPRVLPWHRGAAACVNRRLLDRRGGPWSRVRPIDLLWTFAPVTYGLGDRMPAVYHCVDLYAELPGIDPRVVAAGERALAAAGALAIGTSPVVAKHLRRVGFERVLEWPSTAHVQPFLDAAVEAAARGAGPRNPSALFAGSLRADKVDFSLLAALRRAGVEVHLAGPLSEGGEDGRAVLDSVTRLGATYHGTLGPTDLARLAARCTVGLIPYVINPYTRGVSPLKTFEYLGAGLAVVATSLPGVEPVGGHVWVESSAESFVERVREVSVFSADRAAERMRIAATQTWDGRRAEIAAVVSRMLGSQLDRRIV